MVLSDENADQLFKKHNELCTKLNLDQQTISRSWENFQTINKSYVLEGEALHWLGCAVYVACKSSHTPTVGQSVVKGNCVNLTSLLRHSNLSFAKFFSNMNKYSEMAKMTEEFKLKIRNLKETFCVTCNTFKEFYPLYEKIFGEPDLQDLDQSKQHRNRKTKPVLCNNSKVFEFLWVLFLTLKSDNASYGTDLVKAFHLLYACLDLVFKNAFLADRRDLLNVNFEGLPANFNHPDYTTPETSPCLIASFEKCTSMIVEAMHIKTYVCKELMANLMKKNVLTGDDETLTELLRSDNFESNFKNINREYEVQLLNKGDFDERIFLSEYKRILMEREQSLLNVRAPPFCEPTDGSLDSPRNRGNVAPNTPLTARAYLGPKQPDSSPYSVDRSVIERLNKLHNMIHNKSSAPSQVLLQVFKTCATNPSAKIQEIIDKGGEDFLAHLPTSEENKNRLQYGITLFYRLIENILLNEKKIRKDISALVQNDLFYKCMFGCALEMVIFSYNSPKKFPWILSALKIEAYHFVKVIELIIRACKEHLCKDMIKHLNRIEETILESLVWETSSPLWEAIRNSAQEIPKFEETALPGHLLYNDPTVNANGTTPVQNSEISSSTVPQSPGPSASDRFQSPINQNNVNRQLFPTVLAGHSVLQRNAITPDKQRQLNLSELSASNMPKRTGSLPIFFRKFYNLAGVRMENLCSKLQITEMELRHKIWTVFEASIRYTDLIKDRHLDQLLMCAIYVICKIDKKPLLFENIMSSYREQPQATSDIYRNVLVERQRTEIIDGQLFDHPELRNDLINFYNSIYVKDVKEYAAKFRTSSGACTFLSPLPAGRRNLISPNIKVLGNVFVKPLDNPTSNATGNSFNYIFSRSPSKDLMNINRAIGSNGVNGKRLLVDGETETPSKRSCQRKIQALVEERRSQNAE